MTRKKTIALLLTASLALQGVIGELQKMPAILPEEQRLELLQEVKDKKGKKRTKVLK